MKLVKVELKDLKKGYKKTKLDAIIDEFLAMNTAIVRMADWQGSYRSADSCASAMNIGIKRRGYKHIKAITRDRVPYLINLNIVERLEV